MGDAVFSCFGVAGLPLMHVGPAAGRQGRTVKHPDANPYFAFTGFAGLILDAGPICVHNALPNRKPQGLP